MIKTVAKEIDLAPIESAKHLLFIFITIITINAHAQTSAESGMLPIEIDTVINGIDAKMILLKVWHQSGKGSLINFNIGFQNPENKEWVWFNATDVPVDGEIGFTHSFPLILQPGSRLKNVSFLKSIAKDKGDNVFMWHCPCKQATIF